MPSVGNRNVAACAYCGNKAVDTLLYCAKAKKWYCNGKANEEQQSHALMHAVRILGNTHYLFNANQPSDFEKNTDGEVRCFDCKNRNVFSLGYVRLENNKLRVLCRHPCGLGNRWFPIIDSEAGFFKLLAVRCEAPKANLNGEVDKGKGSTQGSAITLTEANPIIFKNQNGYYETFVKVVKLEMMVEARALKRGREHGVTLEWLPSENAKTIGFTLRAGGLFKVGEDIIVSHGNWKGNAVVLTSEHRNYTASVADGNADLPVEKTKGFKIQRVFNSVPFGRAIDALKHFRQRPPSDDIVKVLLGKKTSRIYNSLNPASFNTPGLPKPNGVQEKAIRHAFQKPITVIEAPPGTGKTTVAAHLAYFYATSGHRVLLCAPSNIAVDNMVLSLARTGLKDSMLRIYSYSILSNPNYSIRGVLAEVALQNKTKQKKTMKNLVRKAKVVCCTCTMVGDSRLNDLGFDVVIIDECSQAYEPEAMIAVAKCTSRLVLIGDSKQLGPLVQSGAVRAKDFDKTLFERMGTVHGPPLMLEVQYRMHPSISRFPSLKFYNGNLKDGVRGLDRKFFRQDVSAVLWPQNEKPIVFFDIQGKSGNREEIAGTGTTYVNRLEGKCLIRLLAELFQFGVDPREISVITMYSGQREYLRSVMEADCKISGNAVETKKLAQDCEDAESTESDAGVYDSTSPWPESGHREDSVSETSSLEEVAVTDGLTAKFHELYKQVQIDTVDAYQGRENDIVIVSCVRSNSQHKIGFLAEPRRLNVALTRARCGLIILGDQTTVMKSCETWKNLGCHYNSEAATRPSPVGNSIYGN